MFGGGGGGGGNEGEKKDVYRDDEKKSVYRDGKKRDFYRESGLLLSAEKEGSAYVDAAMRNAEMLGCRVAGLKGKGECGEGVGDWGGRGGGGVCELGEWVG